MSCDCHVCVIFFFFFSRLTNLGIRVYSQQVICNQLFMQNKLKISFTQYTSTIIKEKKNWSFCVLVETERRDGSQNVTLIVQATLYKEGIFLFYCVMHIPLFIITRNFYFGLSGPHLLVEQHKREISQPNL